MKTRLATGLLVLALLKVSDASGATREFAKRYESALKVVTETDPTSLRPKGTDYILNEFNKLRAAGSHQDISDAVASTLRDTSKREHWVSAMTFASMLGPTFDRAGIVAAVRDNFANFFTLDPVKGINGQDWIQLTTTASLLSYYGTDADVKRLDLFIETLRQRDPSSAESLHVSVARRPQILKQREEAKAEEASATRDRTPQPPPVVVPPQETHEQLPEQSGLKDTIQQGYGDGAVSAKNAMEAFLKTWNPIGRSAHDLKATFGKPREEKADSITYTFDTGAFAWIFEFGLQNGKVVELKRPLSE